MAYLELELLGPFHATLGAQPVKSLNSDMLCALLAYLAVEREREHSRAQVAALLWPERSDAEALSALRFALSNLRNALGDRNRISDRDSSPFLLINRTHIAFNPASDYWLDVVEFHGLSSRSDVPGLERAAALYRGAFLEGVSIPDSPAFEEWVLFKGEEIQRSFLSLLNRLTELQLSGGETGQAARWARKQLELEPYHEQAHRQLMRTLALGSDRSAALAHYETLCRLLAQELACEPEDETQALSAQIRENTLTAPHAPPAILLVPSRPAGTKAGAAVANRFVARQGELNQLRGLLDQALAGQGGVVLIAGEAGAGKTALLDEFSRLAGETYQDLIALRGRCNTHAGAGDPYLPFREILQTLAGDIEGKRAGGTLSPEQARRVWEGLPEVGAALAENGPDLIERFVPGEALLQRAEAFPPSFRTRRWQALLREKIARSREGLPASQPDLFAQVTQVLHVISKRQPLLLAIDDLQWADHGTLALLFHLGRRLHGSRILLVCAYRPLQGANGRGKPAAEPGMGDVLRELRREGGDILIDLEQADGWAFTEAYIDEQPNRLGKDFRQELYTHTGGNPLFTIELLHSFQRQGMLVQDEAGNWVEAFSLDWTYCPPQVEAVIAGHLAGLADEDLELLQAAAIQGEQFVAEVAARVLGWKEEAALQHLSGPLKNRHQLVEAVNLERLALSGQRLSHYRFRHVLLQKSAYNSLDAVRHMQLHEATGRALEAIYGTESERPPSLAPALARHYEAAVLFLPAARALYEAGSLAVRLSSFRQALDLFDHGLDLITGLPPSKERKEIERLLEAARISPQRSLYGIGTQGFADASRRIGEGDTGEVQDRPKLIQLVSEGERLSVQGKMQDALSLAEQLLELATQWEDQSFIALAHWRFGFTHSVIGNLQESEPHFQWILTWLTPERVAEQRAAVGFGLPALTHSFSALNRWWLGFPEQALERSNQAVAEALEQGDLHGQAFASSIGCTVLFLLRSDEAALQERIELIYRLYQQHGIAMWLNYAEVFSGRLLVVHGEDSAGVEQMRRAVAGWQAKGMVAGIDSLVMALADSCLAAARRRPVGDPFRPELLAIGLAAIEPLLGPEAPCGQSYQPELHRLKGELLLERGGLAAAREAAACFERSLQLGREMGALSWQLRAAMSLVRLRVQQGEACVAELADGCTCLREVYTCFTEGFDFPDLQEAAALIGEMWE